MYKRQEMPKVEAVRPEAETEPSLPKVMPLGLTSTIWPLADRRPKI